MKENTDNNDEFNVIICGSREFSDYELLKEKCNYYLSSKISKNKKIIVLSGGARGADTLGEKYAKEMGFTLKTFPAQWSKYGKRAGYLRNKRMAEIGNACIAFLSKDGENKGTTMMVNIAMEKHLLVRKIESKAKK